MKKLKLNYNFERNMATFYLNRSRGTHSRHKKLTAEDLENLCITIQNRIIFKKTGTVLPHYFGFSYWSELGTK